MLEWKVRYYKGTTQLEEVTSSQLSWDELPTEGVIEVDIIRDGKKIHTLRGMDNYWISGSYYGMFNNTGSLALEEEQKRKENGHQEVVYEGKQFIIQTWDLSCENIPQYINFDNVHIIQGIMVSDEHAKLFGLI